MYTVKGKIKKSDIDGKGAFADEHVSKGRIVWLYDQDKDISVTQKEFNLFSREKKDRFRHSAYFSPWSDTWICPPEGEAANYTNHSSNNNLTVRYDEKISSEPFFVANRDIEIGEEITNNYHEFDELTRKEKPEWAEGHK